MSDRNRPRAFLRPDDAKERIYTRDEIAEACDWLRELLRSGPLYQRDAVTAAEECGVPPSLVMRAKKEIGVVSRNVNLRNDHAKWKLWFWSLPPAKSKPRGLLFDDEPPRRASRDDDRW
jgi:hypothetical protein